MTFCKLCNSPRARESKSVKLSLHLSFRRLKRATVSNFYMLCLKAGLLKLSRANKYPMERWNSNDYCGRGLGRIFDDSFAFTLLKALQLFTQARGFKSVKLSSSLAHTRLKCVTVSHVCSRCLRTTRF